LVDDLRVGAESTQADAQLAVLGEALRVPARHGVEHARANEHGVPSKRNEAVASLEVKSTAEPEVVLEDVSHRQPAGAEVHELNACLDDVRIGGLEALVDPPQERRVNLVLGVEHPGDRAIA